MRRPLSGEGHEGNESDATARGSGSSTADGQAEGKENAGLNPTKLASHADKQAYTDGAEAKDCGSEQEQRYSCELLAQLEGLGNSEQRLEVSRGGLEPPAFCRHCCRDQKADTSTPSRLSRAKRSNGPLRLRTSSIR